MDRYNQPQVIISNPEVTVKSVCGQCNNGWMSDLEAASIPIIGSMFNDLSVTLDQDKKRKITEWILKTAMVLDSTRLKADGARFYGRTDCAAMRVSRAIPPNTRVWIGRSHEKHLLAHGIDYQDLEAETHEAKVKSTITTIVAGHFVAQSITQRKMPRFDHLDMPVLQPKPTNWDAFLLPIWPSQRVVRWPTQRSFSNGGPEGIAYLVDRWRTGERVERIAFEENNS